MNILNKPTKKNINHPDTLISKAEQQKQWIPKVVKFSGGRTSGMLLLQLLENGELCQWRGDCVIFCNTSAEHKATYAFVARIKHICEDDYNIPFFMIEYKTYEAKNSRGYVRRESYRLVNEYPYSDNNTDGYHYKGEVFEELISNKGTLPSVHQRTCTVNMKIIITNQFLADWYGQKASIQYLGHSGSSKRKNKDIIQTHKQYNGTLPDEVIVNKKAFVQDCNCCRPSQEFADFTAADINYSNKYLLGFVKDSKAQLFNNNSLKFSSYLGIRYDEKSRAVKIRKRIIEAKEEIKRNYIGKKKKTYKYATQPPNEIINMPMIKARITKDKVIEFWRNKDYDLDLPFSGLLSNCVFCPLKGMSNNQLIQKRYGLKNTNQDTPQSLSWWVYIENKYSRKILEPNKNDYTHVGFFGSSADYTYQKWLDDVKNKTTQELVYNSEKYAYSANCSCTD